MFKTPHRTHSFFLLTLTLLLTLGGVLFPHRAKAYPVLLPAKSIPWMVGAKRENILALTKKDGKWKTIPVQMEEIEDDVAIVFRNPTESLPVRKKLHKPRTKDPFEGYFDNYHRAVLNDNHFGTCDASCNAEVKTAAQKFCAGERYRRYARTVRIDLDFTKRTAFLVDCMAPQSAFKDSTSVVDQKNHVMKGDRFAFKYKNENSVMLDTFSIGKSNKEVLTDTEMHVFLKPKFMFDMHFENDDVTAEISSLTRGPLSLAVEIATALNVFIFQINKQICCDINIFEDALYFPVLLDLPYSGESFQKGSGLFYGFEVTKGTTFEYYPVPATTPSRPVRGATAMTLERENKVVTVGFGNLKAISGKALSPKEQTQAQLKAKGFPKVSSDKGIFYDATQLPDGFNHFNVWFYVGAQSEKPKLLDYARYGITFKARRVW